VGRYERSWDARSIPSFLSRLRRVLGWRPKRVAAPFGPSITQPVCPRTFEDVVTLDIFEGEARAGSGRRDGLAEDVRADLQRGPGREDDGALEDILQLADIAGPEIGS